MPNNFRCTDRRSDCCFMCPIHSLFRKSHKTAPPKSGRNFFSDAKTELPGLFYRKRSTRINSAGVYWERCELPSGSGQSPATKHILVHFEVKHNIFSRYKHRPKSLFIHQRDRWSRKVDITSRAFVYIYINKYLYIFSFFKKLSLMEAAWTPNPLLRTPLPSTAPETIIWALAITKGQSRDADSRQHGTSVSACFLTSLAELCREEQPATVINHRLPDNQWLHHRLIHEAYT